jgi:phospholipid transport system substrate-binding protein
MTALATTIALVISLQAPDAKTLVDQKYDEIQKIVSSDKTDAGVRIKVTGVLESMTDFSEFGRLTIKKHWEGLTTAQKTLFVHRYRQLIHESYVKHFKANRELKVTHRNPPLKRKGKVLVQTNVTSGETTAEVDYKLHRATTDGPWRAYDIVIDEVSLMLSYRKQFGKIMRTEGFDVLVKKIEDKVAAKRAER